MSEEITRQIRVYGIVQGGRISTDRQQTCGDMGNPRKCL